MSIRFQKLNFFRVAILVLLAGFSNNLFAWSSCLGASVQPDPVSACSSHTGFNPGIQMSVTFDSQTGSTVYYQCNETIGGSYYPNQYSVSCSGAQTCPSGVQPDPATGKCPHNCPDGETWDTGSNDDIVNGYQGQCATPVNRCARRAGQSFSSFTLVLSDDGCAVTCVVGPAFEMNDNAYVTYNCNFTGATSGPAGADPNKDVADSQTPVPNTPNLPTPPLTEDPDPNTGACPTPGSAHGFINGQEKCVPPTKADGTPNVPGNSNGSSASTASTRTDVTTTSTTNNSDGSVTTVSTTTTITVGTSSSSSGSGSDTGANQCDPTATNYLDCIKMSDAVKNGVNGSSAGGGNGNGSGDTYSNADYSTWFNTTQLDQQIEQAKQDLKDQFAQARQNISDGMDLSGAASLPVFGPYDFYGHSFSLDFSQYESQLSIIAQALLVVSLMISAYIVLHR